MIDVHHVIARMQFAQLFQRNAYLLRLPRFYTETMVPLENLMVGITTNFQVVIGKTFVKREMNGREIHPQAFVAKNSFQTLGLLFVGRQDIIIVSFLPVFQKVLGQQVEILIKNRLPRSIELNNFRMVEIHFTPHLDAGKSFYWPQ